MSACQAAPRICQKFQIQAVLVFRNKNKWAFWRNCGSSFIVQGTSWYVALPKSNLQRTHLSALGKHVCMTVQYQRSPAISHRSVAENRQLALCSKETQASQKTLDRFTLKPRWRCETEEDGNRRIRDQQQSVHSRLAIYCLVESHKGSFYTAWCGHKYIMRPEQKRIFVEFAAFIYAKHLSNTHLRSYLSKGPAFLGQKFDVTSHRLTSQQ